MKNRIESPSNYVQADATPHFSNISEQMLFEAFGTATNPKNYVQRDSLGNTQRTVRTEAPAASAVTVLDPNFRPTSVDVDQFLKDEKILNGLTKADLHKISVEARSSGDSRRQRTAGYLETHFDDVRALSSSGVEKITRDDLSLYHGFLRQNELKDNPKNPPVEEWRKAHFDHESSLYARPIAFELGLNMVAYTAAQLALKIPSVAQKLGPAALTNPGKFFAIAIPAAVAVTGANHFAGREIGNAVSRRYNGESINTQFYDEAAPAMKRLLGGKNK